MHKMLCEILLALRGEGAEKKKGPVEQTEELIGLAHQLTFHQLQQYNVMLFGLAILAHEVDPSQLKKICKEIIAISHYNPS